MKKKKWELKMTRRQLLKAGMIGGAGLMMPLRFLPAKAFAALAATGLSDPAPQPKFVNLVPDALNPGFIYDTSMGKIKVAVGQTVQYTGLVGPGGAQVPTTVWGYGDGKSYSWPGRTFQVQSGQPLEVKWENRLDKLPHLLPVDTSLHWCYSLPGYTNYTIDKDGVPIVSHLHGGHTDFQYDGNPEFFFSPGYTIRGPQWVDKKYIYDNSQPAGNLWYHDHALGITRLNVYAGLAGFYFVRDANDTGLPDNPIGLPAWPYEKAYAIQDRMFKNTGELFYPAFPGDPFYDDFIAGEGAMLPPDIFPNGGPTALAEFFGDHMVVNGLIWPKEDVEPRNYRMHLLNGCDSRFMLIQFVPVPAGETDFANEGAPIPFYVIGSDQGLATSASQVDTLLFEPGSRYDIIFDFKNLQDQRIILKNIGGDEPFGTGPGEQIFGETDRIMAFDVSGGANAGSFNPALINVPSNVPAPTRTRKVALFEGRDEFNRLQPLLGTAEPAKDYTNTNYINWPNTPVYSSAVFPDGTSSPLTGPMEGSIAWHSPTTENPALGTTEEWEVWNMTGDSHPIHLHLVHFEVLGRQEIVFDTAADDEGFLDGETANDDGVYLVPQPTVQHNSVAGVPSTYGSGFKIVHPSNPADAYGAIVTKPDEIVENAPKDMVIALPGQITRIKAKFDKPGRYVWHCHILSHEDHEMMRVLHVGPGA